MLSMYGGPTDEKAVTSRVSFKANEKPGRIRMTSFKKFNKTHANLMGGLPDKGLDKRAFGGRKNTVREQVQSLLNKEENMDIDGYMMQTGFDGEAQVRKELSINSFFL